MIAPMHGKSEAGVVAARAGINAAGYTPELPPLADDPMRLMPVSLFFAAALVCPAASLAVPAATHAATAPSVTLHGMRFSTEFATDDDKRELGLMYRKTLATDHSMLFVFPVDGPQAFWMKNTLIPLDMLYFDGSRKLVSMQLNVPPCQADPCPSYPSNAPARYVLELAAGTASRIGAEVGDTLTIDGDVGAVH